MEEKGRGREGQPEIDTEQGWANRKKRGIPPGTRYILVCTYKHIG